MLSVGSATGLAMGWPSWLPIQINQIGIQWNGNINTDPLNFTLTFGASVTGIKGIPGVTISGSVQGVRSTSGP